MEVFEHDHADKPVVEEGNQEGSSVQSQENSSLPVNVRPECVQVSTMDIEGTWLEVVCIKKNKSILYFALALLSAVLLGLVGFITYDVIFKQGHKWLEYFLCVSLVLSFFPIFIYLFRSVYIAVFNDKLVCSRNPKKLLTSADTFARDPEKTKVTLVKEVDNRGVTKYAINLEDDGVQRYWIVDYYDLDEAEKMKRYLEALVASEGDPRAE